MWRIALVKPAACFVDESQQSQELIVTVKNIVVSKQQYFIYVQMSWPQTETVSTKFSCMTDFFKQKEKLNQTPKHQEPLFTLDFKWKPETLCLWQTLFFRIQRLGVFSPSCFWKVLT